MTSRYAIGPSIGVARLGNSPEQFYLEPDRTGGLPLACDAHGNVEMAAGKPAGVRHFKDALGRVKRQGAYYRIFEIADDGSSREVTLDDPQVQSITWTVHLANKKACWYQFSGLEGNLLYGAGNSYAAQQVALRNPDISGTDARRKLIIDPGPRTVSGRRQHAAIDQASSGGYAFASWPPAVVYGDQITSLGDALTDDAGRLIVLGGFGRSGGDTSITSFAGANSWHDDISDGPVVCTVTLKDGTVIELQAWCLVGSPKFAPEVENIVTLDDTMYDTAVRCLGADPAIYANGAFNTAYAPNFERDILPILQRPGGYRWVANTPSMNSVSPPPFDPRDKSDATKGLRAAYLALFRVPSPENAIGPAANTLFTAHGFPMMPLNSGSNSVFNQKDLIDKFLTLTETQYFFLSQWAAGQFDTAPPPAVDPVTALTAASTGNCVGGPFCPGIEVTWSTRNPNLYSAFGQIRQRHPIDYYNSNGLSPTEDETAAPLGCEPGDLTKRMAIPWQADFFQCSIQVHQLHRSGAEQGGRHSDATDLLCVLVAAAKPLAGHYWRPWHRCAGAGGNAGRLPGHVHARHQHLRPDDRLLALHGLPGEPEHRAVRPAFPLYRGAGAQSRGVHRRRGGGWRRQQCHHRRRPEFCQCLVPADTGPDSRSAGQRRGRAGGRRAHPADAPPSGVGGDVREFADARTAGGVIEADVCVIGGGPAGAAAALTLARYTQHQVLLVEASRYGSTRVGETVSAGVVPLLSYLGAGSVLASDATLQSFGSAGAWGSDQVVERDFIFTGRGQGLHLDRSRFDAALAGCLDGLGGALRTGAQVREVTRDADRWRVDVDGADGVSARIVIDATGRPARIARRLGAERRLFDRLVGLVCHLDLPDAAGARATLVETVPEGWWYTAPLPHGQAVAALMTDADLLRGLRIRQC